MTIHDIGIFIVGVGSGIAVCDLVLLWQIWVDA
jgi:hypothetical protein